MADIVWYANPVEIYFWHTLDPYVVLIEHIG